MRLIRFSRFFINLLILAFCATCYAQYSPAEENNTEYPWAVMFYAGETTQNTLGQVFSGDINSNGNALYSLELSHQLSKTNPFRHFLQPFVGTVEVVGNVTYRHDILGPIYEFNPYLSFRWNHFPWNKVILTSLALGEGISYDTRPPTIEQRNSDQTQHTLNYLMFEVTAALPQYPQWELISRIHHRSGVFGLYGAGNNGSTAIGLGLRYHF